MLKRENPSKCCAIGDTLCSDDWNFFGENLVVMSEATTKHFWQCQDFKSAFSCTHSSRCKECYKTSNMCICQSHNNQGCAVRGVGDVNRGSPDGRTSGCGAICEVPPRSATLMPSKGSPGMGASLSSALHCIHRKAVAG